MEKCLETCGDDGDGASVQSGDCGDGAGVQSGDDGDGANMLSVVTACIPILTWLLSPMTESSALIKDKQWKYENKTDFNLPRENNKPCLPTPGTRPTSSSGSQSPVSV